MGQALFELFQQITHGVYIVGVTHRGEDNAFTAAWLMQLSFDPLLLALSINPHHRSYALLMKGAVFSVNVLGEGQLYLAKHFAQPAEADKLAAVPWRRKTTGAPVLSDAIAYFDCRLRQRVPAGDHELVIGQVVDGQILDPGASPLVYREVAHLDGSEILFPNHFSE
ncbi:MAG: flavin reductase family protein [Gammaproteobacteria bacterium]